MRLNSWAAYWNPGLLNTARRIRYYKAMPMRALTFAALLLLTGCLTHLPPQAGMCHLRNHWASNFEAAQARAQAEGKPLLVCLVAGKIDGTC